MDPPRRILLIRPSALGDVCRSVPILATLRAAYSHAQIDWLVQDTFAPAIECHSALSGVVAFPRRRLARAFTPAGLADFFDWSACLSDPNYDLVIDAQGLARSGLLAAMTGATTRLGYANAQEAAAVFYTHRVRVPRSMHAVDRMVTLVCEGLGIPGVPDMRLHADPCLLLRLPRGPELVATPFIVLAPTSRWPAKRWPADRFASLARHLLDLPSAGAPLIALIGAPSERDQCAPLLELASREPRVVDLIGATSVASLMSLIQRAALVVANDSAPLHMAVGFDRPIVALFGPTDISRVGPYQRGRDVLQHLLPGDTLDHKLDDNVGLMHRIGVDEVLAACRSRVAWPRL